MNNSTRTALRAEMRELMIDLECACCLETKDAYRFPAGSAICHACHQQAKDAQARRSQMLKLDLDEIIATGLDAALKPALLLAAAEGRLHPSIAQILGVETGRHDCPVCGMLHWYETDANDCCMPGLEQFRRENPDWVEMDRYAKTRWDKSW